MECEAVIVALGIYFMGDALYFLKKCSCYLHQACVDHFNRKCKSTIVRKIGNHSTWIKVPRCNVSIERATSSVQLENRIEELEKELLQLQLQVSNILLKKDSKETKYSNNNDDIVTSTSLSLPPPPPPLPPPPPPLPPTGLLCNITPLVKTVPKSANVVKDTTSTFIEELSKRPPKLRHVERSPGGRPVRVTPASTDPADVLAAVLRKRFEAIHG
ncbi:mitochondrial fission regulator 1-like [Macrosteles quadrilineatus]|uniref:mitochondrial fission regulator 1-like n=1 Tax=Macrosteles quadrilineatus TaxID=74068 RepID=UPI0023E105B1|nr:mitochondrial fission regulator 1-like [Macrosteles quadrilineatus]